VNAGWSKKFPFEQSPSTQPEGVKHGVVVASQGTNYLRYTSIAVQVKSEPVNYHDTGFFLGAMAKCCGTNYLEARNLSRYRN